MNHYYFQKSYLDMLILKLLQERDMYGYEIMEELQRRSNDLCDMKAGTLYPILSALTNEGLIQPYEKTTENDRIRKYYKITDAGIQSLVEKKSNWLEYCTMINRLIAD